jgi:hypothetical protein
MLNAPGASLSADAEKRRSLADIARIVAMSA